MSCWRTGDPDRRGLYHQDGEEPAEGDRFLGMMETRQEAKDVAEAMNRYMEGWVAPAVGDVWRSRKNTALVLRILEAQGGGQYLCAWHKIGEPPRSTFRKDMGELNRDWELIGRPKT